MVGGLVKSRQRWKFFLMATGFFKRNVPFFSAFFWLRNSFFAAFSSAVALNKAAFSAFRSTETFCSSATRSSCVGLAKEKKIETFPSVSGGSRLATLTKHNKPAFPDLR